jgi:hypothetical protein
MAMGAESGSVDEDDDSDMDSDHDDETVMTESQMIGDNMFDIESDNEDEEEEHTDFNYRPAMDSQSEGPIAKRRLRLGPPQDSDVSGKKVPPQVTLKHVEIKLNKLSLHVASELVHAPPRLQQVDVSIPENDAYASTGMTAPSVEIQNRARKKAKKIHYDDFDKLLGLQSRSANPVHRIMSSFMGPLMRMIRVPVYLMRISFNVTTWRDPFLSFWVLVMLITMCFILIIFPWRSFFFLASALCLGPQVCRIFALSVIVILYSNFTVVLFASCRICL